MRKKKSPKKAKKSKSVEKMEVVEEEVEEEEDLDSDGEFEEVTTTVANENPSPEAEDEDLNETFAHLDSISNGEDTIAANVTKAKGFLSEHHAKVIKVNKKAEVIEYARERALFTAESIKSKSELFVDGNFDGISDTDFRNNFLELSLDCLAHDQKKFASFDPEWQEGITKKTVPTKAVDTSQEVSKGKQEKLTKVKPPNQKEVEKKTSSLPSSFFEDELSMCDIVFTSF